MENSGARLQVDLPMAMVLTRSLLPIEKSMQYLAATAARIWPHSPRYYVLVLKDLLVRPSGSLGSIQAGGCNQMYGKVIEARRSQT